MTGEALRRQVFRGAVWSNVGFLATRALNAVWLLILARLLAPEDFGAFAGVVLYLSISELVSDLGMNSTVVYEQERGYGRRVQTAFVLNVSLALVLSAITFASAPLLAGLVGLEEGADLFRLAALNPLLRAAGNIHDALLMRDMDFRRRVGPELAMVFTRGGASISLALAGFGASALVAGVLVGTVVWSAVHWRLTPFRPSLHFEWAIARSMFSYASGAVALSVTTAILIRVDIVVIGRVLGEEALGLYFIAFRLPELLIEGVAWNMALVAFPALARKRVADAAGLPRVTARLMHFQALYALPIAAGLAVLGPALVVTLFGARWSAAGGVASAVAVMAGVSALAFPLGDVFKALGRQRLMVALALAQAPLLVATLVWAAPGGIDAVGWARAGWAVVHASVMTVAACRVLQAPLGLFVRAIGPAAAAAAGVSVGAGAVRLLLGDAAPLAVLVLGTAGGLGGGALALRAVSPDAFSELREQVAGGIRRARTTVAAAVRT